MALRDEGDGGTRECKKWPVQTTLVAFNRIRNTILSHVRHDKKNGANMWSLAVVAVGTKLRPPEDAWSVV